MSKHQKMLLHFGHLLEIMDDLREKCPWDKTQTMASLRCLTIEETYELSEAILSDKPEDVKEELGDLMLHLVFYAKIASESGHFDMAQVLDKLCKKLISRHPHIYGEAEAKDEEAVKRHWEQIKLQEKKDKKTNTGVLAGVPQSLPALIKAFRIQEKARGVGFDWQEIGQVWEKVQEEIEEFCTENLKKDSDKNPDAREGEFGDLLFALVNFARFSGINPETALEKTNKKFVRRFNYVEQKVAESGEIISEMGLEKMQQYWEEAKKNV